MLTEKLNAAFVDMLNKHIPEDKNAVTVVMDVLNIGREAAYRRLRGEVLFAFSEAAHLAMRLNISLDRALGVVGAGSVLFQLQFTDFYSMLEKYNEILLRDVTYLQKVGADPTAIYAWAGTIMPQEFYMRHPDIAKFKFFKWLYQNGLVDNSVRTFEDMQVPEALVETCGAYIRAMEKISTNYYVFDYGGFRHWVNALCAFRAMNLISVESIRKIRDELLLVLDTMEQITMRGAYSNGSKVFFYLSDIDLESSYSCLTTSNSESCSIGVFSLNSLRTNDSAMIEHVTRWIRTQTRYATLISCSGERQRLLYFKRQREVLAELEREGVLPSPEVCL